MSIFEDKDNWKNIVIAMYLRQQRNLLSQGVDLVMRGEQQNQSGLLSEDFQSKAVPSELVEKGTVAVQAYNTALLYGDE